MTLSYEYAGSGYQVGNHVLCSHDSLGQLRIEFSEYDIELDELALKTIYVRNNADGEYQVTPYAITVEHDMLRLS